MKIKHLLLIVFLGVLTFSCQDLNLQPKGFLGENELFGNEHGVKVYFAKLYDCLPIEDFNYYATNGYRVGNYWQAQKMSQGCMSGEFVNDLIRVDNDGFDYWPYEQIREVNTFILGFPNYRDNFTENVYNALMGEAHFLRAFFYFGLVKRYGGIPIITELQDPTGEPEVLMVPRNKEYEVWKFVYEDLKFAMDNMVETSDFGRANKYAAAALMSRAMLYAATNAKYSQYLGYAATEEAVQQGLAGMPQSYANEFFQYSYDAGKFIENSGNYALYTTNYPDKALNFANLFLNRDSKENIFCKDYNRNSPSDTRLRHSYDATMSPYPDMSAQYGAQAYAPLDVMLMYDFPDLTDAAGKPVRFDNRSDIRNGMEPRLRGSMYFDGDQLRGATFSIQRGIYLTFPGLASDAQRGNGDAPINSPNNRIFGDRDLVYQGILITGNHGMFESQGYENNCVSGAFVRKYINPEMPTYDTQLYYSAQPWIVFRLGEIYLNMAEACYEMGRKEEAFDYIEKIRDRAGAKVTRPADDPTDLSSKYGYPIDGNLQFIRDERYRELWGENHRWWDLRRWCVVDRVLDNYILSVLMCYYVFDEGKYIYLNESEKLNRPYTALKSAHYEPIPQAQIDRNNNLRPQNPVP